MSRLAILGFRILVVVIIAGSIMFQVFAIPFVAFHLETISHVQFAIPYLVAGVLTVFCVQVSLIAIWVLLSMVGKGAIFSPKAFRWVDLIIGAAVVATLLTLAVGIHLYFVVNPILDAPGLVAIAFATIILGAAFVLLMLVMRGLLKSATDMHTELEEVV